MDLGIYLCSLLTVFILDSTVCNDIVYMTVYVSLCQNYVTEGKVCDPAALQAERAWEPVCPDRLHPVCLPVARQLFKTQQ